MALENLISVSFSDKELKDLDTHLNAFKMILKGKTVNISADQRQQYGRIANQNKLIVDKVKNYMEQNPEWVPNFIDKEEFDRDYAVRKQIEDRVHLMENLTQQLIDTKTLLDHDNYNNALSFYRMVRYLSKENEPGAKTVYEDMKKLFNRKHSNEDTDQSE
ncbi:hypothetical protein ACJRPK_11050 [Aquimarina sp. 2-A2]|uniref:hypothetical protein n=1 Tax=Aquimarina sp. 2-A2 TaxID=3382644 RepID=UPI00387EF558